VSGVLTDNLRIWTTISAILAGGAHSGLSQEALYISLAGEDAAAARHSALLSQSGNMQLGLASFLIGASFGMEWNDNVAYSDANQQRDWIFRPGFSLDASMPLTEQNGLFATFDVGYAKYVRYSQYDQLLIAPGTQLAFDMYVKDFHFEIHDIIALTDVALAQGTVSGTGDYGEFSNLAGIGVDWDLNQLIASFSYDHQTAISTHSNFSYQDRNSDNFILRGSFEPSAAWTVGPEAGGGFTRYREAVLNDSQNASVGAFVTAQPTTLSQATVRAGYTWFSFDALPGHPPIPNTSGYYLSANLSHRLNDVISFSIAAGRQITLGINSELLDLWYARPIIDWHLFEKFHLDTHFVYENGIESGTTVLVANESYTLLGGGIGTGCQLTEKLLLGLVYDYSVKDSNLAQRNYHQNKVLLQLQYTF
jgi:hypothetical protein